MLELIQKCFSSLSAFATRQLIPAVLILAVGLLVIRALMQLLSGAFSRSKWEKAASDLILSVVRVAAYLLLSLIAASALGIDVTGVVALASVLTLALSLALQNALSNLIGGFSLLYTKPFHLEDYVQIGEQSGTVKQIGLTYTRLLTSDGKTISIPNSTVVSAEIVNFTVSGQRRVDITVPVAYECDPEQVMAALLEAADLPEVLPQRAPYTAVSSYGESAVNYCLQVWTATDDYWKVLHTIQKRIPAVFQARGITMTYPHLNVHIKQ